MSGVIEQTGTGAGVYGTAVEGAPVVAAVQRVLRDGLSSGGSAFEPGLDIWTIPIPAELDAPRTGFINGGQAFLNYR